MNQAYFLKSKRLGFRTWTLDDIEDALSLWGDPKVSELIGGPFTVAQIHNRLLTERSMLRQYNVQYWPIFLLETDEFIGCCGLRPYEQRHGIFELGFDILPAHWGHGYAFEGATAVIEYTFNTMNANGIFAAHHPDNLIAKALVDKLGFQYTHNEEYKPTGLYHPSYLLKKSA